MGFAVIYCYGCTRSKWIVAKINASDCNVLAPAPLHLPMLLHPRSALGTPHSPVFSLLSALYSQLATSISLSLSLSLKLVQTARVWHRRQWEDSSNNNNKLTHTDWLVVTGKIAALCSCCRLYFRDITSHLKLIPSHPIPSHPIPSHPIPSHPISSHLSLLYWSRLSSADMAPAASTACLALLHCIPIPFLIHKLSEPESEQPPSKNPRQLSIWSTTGVETEQSQIRSSMRYEESARERESQLNWCNQSTFASI